MEWSKIKTIILLILLGLNGFLLVMVVSQELQAQQFRQEARTEAVTLLERNGITVDSAQLPPDVSLSTLVLEEESTAGEALAHALLGEVSVRSSGARAVYSSALGTMEAFSTGRFAVDFAAGAQPLNGDTPENHAQQLLERCGISASYLESSSEEETIQLTYRQLWEEQPVFNAQITLSYTQEALQHMEGVLLPQGNASMEEGETVTVATLLVRFLGQRNESGRMFSQIVSLVPGYHFSGTRPFALIPAWYITTDTGSYVLSALDGNLL